MTTTYQFTISEAQAQLIATALDTHDRLATGQAGMALQNVFPELDHAMARELETIIKIAAGRRVSDHRTGAFNLRKTLEHAIAWTRTPEGGMSVNFDGPIAGWWDGEPPAVCLRWDGDEAVRVRDRANVTTTLGAEMADVIGTTDIEEATRRVKAWRDAANV